MQPQRYSTKISKVGQIGTLLTSIACAWFFGPLNEQDLPLLENFEAFMEEFAIIAFGDVNKTRMVDRKT